MSTGGYPNGAEYDSSAPYNQSSPSPKEVEVAVSICLSKTVKIVVDEYEIISSGVEDGCYFEEIACSEEYLKELVASKLPLPINSDIKKDNWIVDDFTVIME